MANRTSRTPENDDIFFEVFAESANISEACRVTGYARTSVYEWRDKYPEFAKRWQDSEARATEKLEYALFKRATEGVTRRDPIVWQGEIVAHKEVTEYSDTAAIFLLKARNPEKYRERIDVNVNWRLELERSGVNPQEYLEAMIEAAKQKLLTSGNDDVIEAEIINDAIATTGET